MAMAIESIWGPFLHEYQNYGQRLVSVVMDKVYLVPGRGNKISEIGGIITELGFNVYGREVLPPFSGYRFPHQLAIIEKDLMSPYWNAEAKLIGHSYGGYLLLHSLSELPPFPGSVLLFSPVLGPASSKDGLFIARPPRADVLLQLATTGQFPMPRHLEIYTGQDDDGCDPVLAETLGSLLPGTRVNIIKGQGHQLSAEIIRKALVQFLTASEMTDTMTMHRKKDSGQQDN